MEKPAPLESGISRIGRDIERVAVLGCGPLGSEWIQLCLAAGVDVTAVKLLPRELESTAQRLTSRARDALAAGARLSVTHAMKRLAEADLVIEAAAESVLIKQNVLSEAEMHAAADTPFATTSGSLRVSEISEALGCDKRLIGVHWCNPFSGGNLVELAATAQTTAATLDVARALCARVGKTAIVTLDQPGFIVNQLLVSHILHAIELVERGTAGIEEIDRAMTLSGLCSDGPFATADALGLDVLLTMAKNLYAEHADGRFTCPSLLRHLVRRGALGKKTGAGFYVYEGDARRPNPEASPFAAFGSLGAQASAA